MSDGGEGGVGGEGGEGAGVAGGTSGEGGTPDWLAALPEELRGDATLTRYKSVDDLAKGHIEAHKVAKSKVLVPGEGASEEDWGKFYDAVGRPADAKDYDIPAAEGLGDGAADWFRGVAHQAGLTATQAKALAAANNERVAGIVKAANDASAAEVEAFKTATPDYATKLAKAQGLAKTIGLDPEIADQLDLKLGSANLLKFMFGLADKFGEDVRVDDPDDPAPKLGGDLANAEQQLTELQKSPEWRKKINDNDPQAIAQRQRLLDAARAQRAKKGS